MDRTGGIVFDMEGVLHIGYEPLPGADTALAALDRAGVPHVILTNTTSKTRATIAARYAVKSAYASLEEALSDSRLAVERPDAAVVCTPAQLHIPMAQQLADRGIHLLIGLRSQRAELQNPKWRQSSAKSRL